MTNTFTIDSLNGSNPLGNIQDGDKIVAERVPGVLGVASYSTAANGSVVPGLLNQLGYYAAAGNAISGLTAVASAILTTNASSAPVWVAYTGTGSPVLNTSPSFVTPVLGTPTSGTLTNCTGLPIAGTTGYGTGVATFLATPSSANLATALTDESGSGAVVFNNNAVLFNPTLSSSTGLTVLTVTNTSSAVNYTTIYNNAAGSAPIIAPIGADTNIGYTIQCKGTGVVSTLTTNTVPLVMSSGTGYQHTTSFNAANTAANRTVTFPDKDFILAGTVSETFTTPNIGAATATSITFSPTTSGIIGTTTNNAAATGIVGETITATGSAVAIITNTQTNVTSISLTAGHWIVYGAIKTTPAATTTQTQCAAGINTTSATLPTIYTSDGSAVANITTGTEAPTIDLKLSGTTTVYLVALVQYAISTLTVSGTITGMRVR